MRLIKYLLLAFACTPMFAQIGPNPGSSINTFHPEQVYALGNSVIFNGVTYISLANSNVGWNPATSASEWGTVFSTGGSGITLTTTGSSGAATLIGTVLNVPIYSGGSQTFPAAGIMVSTGTAFGTSLTAPVGTIVGTTDTQTLTNKTVDTVSPTTMAFLDASSSVQTQINAKSPLASPTFTGTATTPALTVSGITGLTQCLHVSTAGVVTGTGSDCGSGGSSTAWSSLTAPTTTLALTFPNADTTVFTYGSATSVATMFTWQDTASNTGTGIIGLFHTAASSAAIPWQADANGVGWKVNATGQLVSTGTGSGVMALSGLTSGTITQTVPSVAGTATVTWGSGTGTPAITATAPLAITTSTGNITCTTCTTTIASGTATLGTSAIASTACATVVTVTATGAATTDAIAWTPNASIKAVTGYTPSTSGGLSIAGYPTSGNVNFDVCNWTSASITPGAVTLNWRVTR